MDKDSGSPGQMRIGAMLWSVGVHPAAWLHPSTPLGGEISLPFWIDLARKAEAAKLDFVFRADTPNSPEGRSEAISRRIAGQFEPITLMSALAAATSRIGLAATASTSFTEPYNVARLFASLDHLSGGRAAWNVVASSSPAAALNFGQEELEDHGLRYERAEEHVDVVTGLWDSWEADAVVRERETGIFFDPAKRHDLGHRGRFYKVRGPLDISRTPQGRPVIMSAGGSDAGMQLAARVSEVVFSVDLDLGTAKAFYDDLKGRMREFGRSPDELKIVCAINPFIGQTDSEGRDKMEALQALIHPAVGRDILAADLGVDLTELPLDEPIPVEALPKSSNLTRSYFDNLVRVITEQRLTLRQLYLASAGARGGMNSTAGSVQTIADRLEQWFTAGAADGFMLRAPHLPGGLDDFAEMIVPELRRRGLFRTDYSGTTLREHLGLAVPPNRYRTDPG